ncbi:ATP phosphoribosyltransferase regulatory subunit [Aliiroseovarius lamellibrachiae]|uniref:ATP phosphoribosyltransferase regulatory subunit n=1 Tax=Aliiroseovarius lamellibrachiae TaxID=1924933 RepID=UPI001BE01DA6|nr:ATP phosphoribosyltransferase regulatory subunit [Aliiroseovarius lamellibrachiae]MBT2129692.1 ATP phosphoribosyltransferase regulatory subunit [Aliiroseovarius lamellibrachiae]
MTDKSQIRSEATRLLSFFQDQGAQVVEADILQPAGTLLDLYGEDIRARAYVTQDPVMGEAMLRPDFTVPVVQMHMAEGAEPARYAYMGEVFRAQEEATHRASEQFQVGYEVFDRDAPIEADAEVFSLVKEVLAPLNLRAATGDMGLLLAAVLGLKTTDRRKAALERHIWRPRRFRALLDRFSGRAPLPEGREALLAQDNPMDETAPHIGLRSPAEIAARIDALRDDATADPISSQEVTLLDDLMALRETTENVLEHLRDIAVDMPAIAPAVDRIEARAEALARRGVDVSRLDFEGSYGRTSMEYYDGFVFGFYAETRPDLPPVATGGRYDALTRVLGHQNGDHHDIPAIGGVIRPEITLMLGAAK